MKAKSVFYRLAHYILGLLSSIVLFLGHPIASCTIVALFLSYEIVEKWSKRDTGFVEIRDFTAGYLTATLWFLLLHR